MQDERQEPTSPLGEPPPTPEASPSFAESPRAPDAAPEGVAVPASDGDVASNTSAEQPVEPEPVVSRSAFVAGTADDARPRRAEPKTPSLARIYAISAGVAALVSLFAAGMFFAGFYTREVMDDEPAVAATGGASPATQQIAGQPTPPAVVDVSVDDDPARGPEDAAVTIIEFSDFQCPYCGRFFQQTLPQLMAQYGDRIRFVYRDFPLDQIHPNARNAAIAAECADDQGRFWEYHDVLFSNQQALGVADLKRYAEQLGLDVAAFSACLDSQKYNDEVNADLRDGLQAGVTGTPTFFINGRRVVGAQPLQTFQTLIDQALAE
ncbi:MAG TPA: thioredoxin domain-containing protein [Dehalococcoidia bacterium]|nr:thioredoxin domain-containing protein [Dehalococcoidia bacterium]